MTDARLYQLHTEAVKELESGPKYNWVLHFACDAQDLKKLEITDARAEAAKWRSETCPRDLYFTHAQFYTDGVKHIIAELTKKPTSNRALYSLINQDDIRDSGDDPIPSFMSLQCQINGDVLYCACYFRAIEVSKFLKINLEEIRQTLVEIFDGVPNFKKVDLTIFAFRAYNDSDRLPLRRPELEVLYDDELQALLISSEPNHLKKLSSMLRELHGAVTTASAEKLKTLKRILSNDNLKIQIGSKKALFIDQLDAAIEETIKLIELRKRGSHGTAVDMATQAYQRAIEELCASLDA